MSILVYICAIYVSAAVLFLVVHRYERDVQIATVLEMMVLLVSAASILEQLMPLDGITIWLAPVRLTTILCSRQLWLSCPPAFARRSRLSLLGPHMQL
jgi:hypothetical protein